MKNGSKSILQPLPVDDNLQGLIREASQQTHLSQAEVMRQALRIGVPELVKRLQAPRKPRRSILEYMDAFRPLLQNRNRELVKPSRVK